MSGYPHPPAQVPKVRLPFLPWLPFTSQCGDPGWKGRGLEARGQEGWATEPLLPRCSGLAGTPRMGREVLASPPGGGILEGGTWSALGLVPSGSSPLLAPRPSRPRPPHASSPPQKVGMAKPSPAKAPRTAPDLSPSAHETAPTSSGDGSSPRTQAVHSPRGEDLGLSV